MVSFSNMSHNATRYPVPGYCFSPACENRNRSGDGSLVYKQCEGCRMLSYCSRACQKNDWHFHKQFCTRFVDKPRTKTKAKQPFILDFAKMVQHGKPVHILSVLMRTSSHTTCKQLTKCMTLMYVSGHMKCGGCQKTISSLAEKDSRITLTRLSASDTSTLGRSNEAFDPRGKNCLVKLRVDVRCTGPECHLTPPQRTCDADKTTQIFIFADVKQIDAHHHMCYHFILQLPIGHYLIRQDTTKEIIKSSHNTKRVLDDILAATTSYVQAKNPNEKMSLLSVQLDIIG
jgi:hypothetical protein